MEEQPTAHLRVHAETGDAEYFASRFEAKAGLFGGFPMRSKGTCAYLDPLGQVNFPAVGFGQRRRPSLARPDCLLGNR